MQYNQFSSLVILIICLPYISIKSIKSIPQTTYPNLHTSLASENLARAHIDPTPLLATERTC